MNGETLFNIFSDNPELDEHDFSEGFRDGRAFERAQSFGDTIPLPTDPSKSWQRGFKCGRVDYQIALDVDA